MPRGRASGLTDGALAAKSDGRKGNGNGANLGFEAQLFLAADKLRKNLEPSDYKHVALGLIFLKHISDAFEAKHAALLAEDPAAAEDPDEYLADNVFWVPKEARWSHLQANAKQPTIGKLIDDAMVAIEKDNPGLKGVLPKDYNRPALDKVMLGELIDLISGIAMGEPGDKAKDILGRVYEYFLGGFAGSEGKRGGEFYTPRSVVRVLVEMLEPVQGPRLRPVLRLGRHVRAVGEVRRSPRRADRRHRHLRPGVELHDVAARQDEPRGARHRRRHPLEQRGQLPQGRTQGPALRLHPRQSAVQRLRLGRRAAARGCALELRRAAGRQRQLRLAPAYPAGTSRRTEPQAWCSPTARCRRPRRARTSIRKAMVEADVVDCMVALPGQLFYSTQIPACLWFLARNKNPDGKMRDRRGEVLFIDARKLGTLVDRTRKEFSDDDIAKIAGTYHAWREGKGYADVPAFCKAVKPEEIRKHKHALTPGRYVGAADVEDDDVPFPERFKRLQAKLEEQFAEADKLTAAIRAKLAGVGVDG